MTRLRNEPYFGLWKKKGLRLMQKRLTLVDEPAVCRILVLCLVVGGKVGLPWP